MPDGLLHHQRDQFPVRRQKALPTAPIVPFIVGGWIQKTFFASEARRIPQAAFRVFPVIMKDMFKAIEEPIQGGLKSLVLHFHPLAFKAMSKACRTNFCFSFGKA
jgi:hypothetical protein